MRLKDKVAIITGGPEGIGRAVTLGYIREGARVAVCARTQSKLDEMAKKMGEQGIALQVDVSVRAQVDEMVKDVVTKFGRIDILVNNAAIFPSTPFMDITEEEWRQVIDVNLHGVFNCTQAAAGVMLEQGAGRIINVTSAQALIGVPRMSHCTAAKGGLIARTRELASELSPLGINVNCVAPGLTETEKLVAAFPKEYLDALAELFAIKRAGRPEEMVGICVLLASDEGSYITGETISVDGGLSKVKAWPTRLGG